MRAVARTVMARGAPLFVAAAAAILLVASGLGLGLDRYLAEARDWLRERPASGEVHIIEVDARSIRALRRWPWPRSLHGAAVDRLREAGARTIAFDIDFSSESDPAEDAAFAAALIRAGGAVILPTFTQQVAHGVEEAVDSVPIAPLADNAFLATANVQADDDGALRRMPFGGETLGVPRPSLAAMLAERTDNIGQSFAIDYAIDPDTVPRHSFIDLIEGHVRAAALAGKRVIIGSTAVELGDHYNAPRLGEIAGVVIQALAAETLIAGSERFEAGAGWPLALALLLVLLLATGRPSPLRIALLAVGALSFLPLSIAAEAKWALTFEIAPAMAALLVAAAWTAGALRRRRERELSRIDAPTGLPNLLALEDEAASQEAVEIVVARIGGFATLAAALGPEAAARLVADVAGRLGFGEARGVCRLEEGTLAWLRDEAGEAEGFEALAALSRDYELDQRRIEVTLHFGIAAGPGAEAGRVAANASLAAAQAERSGARVQRFTESDSKTISRNLALLGELESALRSGAIRNFYQPKLDMRTGLIKGAEALVRWFHPERGLIPPDEFVPLIEEQGRARELTTHVLRNAIADAVRWRDEFGIELDVAINVSASLVSDAGYMAELQAIAGAGQLPLERLTVEVTETAAMAEPDAAIASLQAWRALGVGVSIDDFGTGQSSLGYIRLLPATELKIDRSFVKDLGRTPRNAIMVRATIAMAHELGLTVVAEGVEDDACLATLAALGCDAAQGYLIGRAMAPEALAQLVLEGRTSSRAAVS